MGCCATEETHEDKIEMLLELELDILMQSGLPLDKTERKFTTIEMEGKPFQVRTFIIGEPSPEKKTLVFLHGMVSASVVFFSAMALLADKYHIVMFDCCAKGANTKPE